MQQEEAPLPRFVYQLDGLETVESPRMMKGFNYRRPLAGVNVRMETPVIYFYTDEPFDAQVDVGFHGGAISEWFPHRSAGEKLPPILRDEKRMPITGKNVIDFGAEKKREGSIRWNVRVEPAGEDQWGRVFQGGELPCWIHPRQTDSALVTNAKGETDKYLFYRGIGNLDLPVVFTATDDVLTASGRGRDGVGSWLVFDLNAKGQARWTLPPPIAPAAGGEDAGEPVHVPLQDQPYHAGWKKDLYEDAVGMLVGAGLYRKEADAMIQTWWDSYFGKPGLRVFWIVPRNYVDEVLPLTADPAPARVERVIVGRTEILTPTFEKRLLTDYAAVTKEKPNRWRSDRFFPAYNARVGQLKALAGGKFPAWALPVGSDWIDLQDEGSTLYFVAQQMPFNPPADIELVLATEKGEERCRAGIDANGKTRLWIYGNEAPATGPVVAPGRMQQWFLRIVSHAQAPDEVYLKIVPAGTPLAEPKSDEGWTLINRGGHSNANLARVHFRGAAAGTPAFFNVRVASTFEGLGGADIVPVQAAAAGPPAPGRVRIAFSALEAAGLPAPAPEPAAAQE